MKIIHCADIHLDSALSTNMVAMQAQKRREEILKTWVDMVEYAHKKSVEVIIIAGDWFDTSAISAGTAEVIAGTVNKYSHMDFLYLPGNHDEKSCISMLGKHNNLRVFGVDGDCFRYGQVVITKMGKKLNLNADDINIVVAHEEMPDVSALTGKNIDYFALGHIHKYMEGRIDARGVWCYCGCLEARGFDECGRHGFVELHIDKNISYELVPWGYRQVHNIEIEVSCDSGENGMDTVMITDKIANGLLGIPGKDMVRVVLKGSLAPGEVINTAYIHSYFKDKFYGFRVEDLTAMVLDVEAIGRERSLKGEFIRAVMASDENEDMKRSIIRCGLSALIGEVME